MNTKSKNYLSAIVLGLNDAIVEITGTLVGLTLALENSTVIGVVGLIMGIAAALSMAGSQFLSSEEESMSKKNALINTLYTGITYFSTVIILVTPYFIFENVYHALFSMILLALLVIITYAHYSSKINNHPFSKKFLEMFLISASVSLISFLVGIFIRKYFGVEI